MTQLNNPVWLVLDSRSFGGIETHVLELARGLLKHQISVEVIFIADYGEHPIKPLLKQARIPVRVMKHGLSSLIAASIRVKPLIIHTHGYKAGIYGRLAGLLSGRTLVSTFHAGETLDGKLALYDAVDRISSKISHRVIAVSAQIRGRLRQQCTVMNNFVAVGDQTFPGPQIAFVGRLSHEKGPDHFLRLSSYFSQQSFHFYGDGPMRQWLEAEAGENLVFHGHQNNMAEQWHNIGLLVMPSRSEGLPMAALEAMAHGIPVCAYRVGSLDKLVNKRNGWLPQPGDFTGLRNSISQWLSCSVRQRFARSRLARKSVLMHFSDRVMIPQIIDCYNLALRKNRQGAQQLLVQPLLQALVQARQAAGDKDQKDQD